MNESSCVCGGKASYPIIRNVKNREGTKPAEFDVVRCESCGLARTNPRPLNHNRRFENMKSAANQIETIAHKERLLSDSLAEELIGKVTQFKKGGKLLDVGCHVGVLLELAKKKGFEVTGVEVADMIAKYARGRGLEIYNTDLCQINLHDATFDVVTISHVLEHMAHPVSELLEIRRVLKSDGILVIEVPDISIWLARFQGNRYLNYSPWCHFWQFESKTLRKLLKSLGFKPIKQYQVYHNSPWPSQKLIFKYPGLYRDKISRRWHLPITLYSMLNDLTGGWSSKLIVSIGEGIFNTLAFLRITGDSIIVVARK